MSVLLHISDTHFGVHRPAVVDALLALAARQRPDVTVLSGDITQRARPDQFRAAKDFVYRLGTPVLAVPGNHDIALFDLWSRLTRPYAQFSRVFGNDLEPVYRSPDLLIACVKTTRRWRHRHGEVSPAQIERVARLLGTASAQQLRLVVVHQPAASPPAGKRSSLLRGHRDALRAWSAAGADLVLGGHDHLPGTLAQHGLPRRLWVIQAGTAVSSRTHPEAPNSVNILRWDGAASCAIEQWDYAPMHRSFIRVSLTRISPERG